MSLEERADDYGMWNVSAVLCMCVITSGGGINGLAFASAFVAAFVSALAASSFASASAFAACKLTCAIQR